MAQERSGPTEEVRTEETGWHERLLDNLHKLRVIRHDFLARERQASGYQVGQGSQERQAAMLPLDDLRELAKRLYEPLRVLDEETAHRPRTRELLRRFCEIPGGANAFSAAKEIAAFSEPQRLDGRKEFIDFLLEKYHDLPRALLLIESWLNDRRDLAGALLRTATSESRSLDESRRVEAWDLDTEESNGRQNKQKLHDLLLRLRRGDYPPLLCPATAPKVDAVTAAKHLGVMERTDNLLSLLRRLKTEKLADSEVADGSELFWAVEPQEMTKGAQKEMAETAVEAAKPGASPRVLVEKEPLSVFRRNGEFWEVRLDGADTRAIGLSKGMDHIAYLLSYPNICKAIPALQLQGAAADLPTEVGEDVHGGGSFQPVLDPEAKVSYRKRLLEIEEELAEAREHHDLGRIEKLEEEKASLLEELARAAGWQGKDRQLGPDGPERRAAKAVGNALDRAYSRIEKQVPALAKHLREAIKREGNGFAYRPGPESPDWVLR